ncbi:hypothetical protein [Microvirga arsenatis]|uniref:Uncharacterized protein n=1 Tax=Microvirga arsenatis TaxID=2692265 RepID=A0ABW9YU64_9HYPH|nr:hypothetical protein [Microvirga arsenatis]NBJ09428.1 hypothetical protein [Microvirga arsenatis]NBJ23714.1 hypothetical protein [Microvirga arsenatis]
MIVAFFADDTSASHAALLTARGLATVDRPATLVQFTHPGAIALSAPSTASSVPVVRIDAGSRPLADLRRLLDQVEEDGDLILAAPLHLIRSPLLASCRHLPVLPCGATFMGTAAMKKAVHRLRNASPSDRDVPHWLLACGYHNVADTIGNVHDERTASTRQQTTRLLPLAMPLLRRADTAALMGGSPAPSILRHGLLLAAALEAAAADPFADCLDRAGLADMLDPGPGLEDRRLGEKLSALADMFELLSDTHQTVPAARGASRRPDTDRGPTFLPAGTAPRQTARSSRPARRTAIMRELHRRTPPFTLANARPSLRRP